jgi:hypothetical protein
LKKETSEKVPNIGDIKVFKNGSEFSGLWIPGHYQLRHKSLSPPAGPVSAPPVTAPKAKPIKCGVWNGRAFVPTRPIEISMSHDEKLRVINEAFAIGNEVRFFVHDTEVLEAELRAGQQYSIHPRKFERVPDESAQTRDKTPPLRTEGPMNNLQWILLSETGASVMMPVSVKVPEEISLAQLWHRHIANRVQRHVETVRWGKHFRGADEVEDGRVTDLQNNDSVHVVIPAEPAPKGQLEVVYSLEGESIVHRFNVKNTVTMGDIRQRISMAHKGKPIEALSFEGATFADEDSFNDWAFRSGGMPRQIVAKVQPMVQVVLDYMGEIGRASCRERVYIAV